MGGSKKTQTQTTSNTTKPWAAAEPYFTDLYTQAGQALAGTPTKFTGDLYAAPTPAQLQAVDAMKGVANNGNLPALAQQTWANATAGGTLAGDTIAGKYLDPGSNPYIAQAVEAARRPIEQQLTRQILPGIQDQSIAQGAYGGSGFGTAQGLAISDFTQQALDAANKVYYQNYSDERNRQMQAVQLAAQAAALGQAGTEQALTPSTILGQAGTQEQAWQQAALDAALQKFGLDQSTPWTGLNNMASILTAGGFNQQDGTSKTTVKTNPGVGGLLQGAIGLAGLASGFGLPLAGLGGGLSSLLGGGLGAGALGSAAFDNAIWKGASGAAPGVFSFG